MDDQKVEIRTIRDLSGNVYDIYDYMTRNKVGLWKSKQVYFNLEDAKKWNGNVDVEDKRN